MKLTPSFPPSVAHGQTGPGAAGRLEPVDALAETVDATLVVTVEAYAAAQRAEIIAWITTQQVACARHPDIDVGAHNGCCMCWYNLGLQRGAELVRGQWGPTPGRVAERLQREAEHPR